MRGISNDRQFAGPPFHKAAISDLGTNDALHCASPFACKGVAMKKRRLQIHPVVGALLMGIAGLTALPST